MIDEKRAKKALEWVRGFLRAKFGDAVQVVETEGRVDLVAEALDDRAELDEVVKSLPSEIVMSIGNISISVAR